MPRFRREQFGISRKPKIKLSRKASKALEDRAIKKAGGTASTGRSILKGVTGGRKTVKGFREARRTAAELSAINKELRARNRRSRKKA